MTFWYQKPANVNEVVDSVGGYTPSQPSQKYPFQPISPPRVDNKNQPWYGGTRWWGQGPDDIQFNDAAITQTNGDDRYQLSSVWDYLNSWFGGGTAKANLSDTSSVPDLPNTADVSTQNMNNISNIPQMGRHNMMDQSGFVKPWSYRND